MATYGRQEYWEHRYQHETESSEWITGWDIVKRLLTSNFLNYASAPAPGGEIHVEALNQWLVTHLHPQHLHLKKPAESVIDEELEFCEPKITNSVVFPSREMARVLNVGCGNSQLSADMLSCGWRNIVNVDYSKIVIQKMTKKYSDDFYVSLESCMSREALLRQSLGLEARDDSPQIPSLNDSILKMTFEHGDICQGIQHPDESFDLIICKKTLDVILCSAGSIADARAMISECFRLLNKAHGVMMIFSSAKPEDRAVFFENEPWTGVLNIKLPSHNNSSNHPKKDHDRKKIDSYVYILYKQLLSRQ